MNADFIFKIKQDAYHNLIFPELGFKFSVVFKLGVTVVLWFFYWIL